MHTPAGHRQRRPLRPPAMRATRRADALGSPPVAYELMGVINVTPDSFSDGGMFDDAASAIAHGRRLAAEGAGILAAGGESNRPGAATAPAAETVQYSFHRPQDRSVDARVS